MAGNILEKPTASQNTFDLFDLPDQFYQDPYPTYHHLQKCDPIHRNADGSYFISRYDDVSTAYRTPSMTSDKEEMFRHKFGDGPLFQQHTTSMLFRDPPDHTRLRKLVAHAFTPRALARLEWRVIELVDELLDKCADNGGMEVMREFAFYLPVEVICAMLGLPPSERDSLKDWSQAILAPLEPLVSREEIENGNRAVEEFSAYLADLLRSRRSKSRSRERDVLDELIDAEEDGDRLSEAELVQNCILLLNAGHETTTNLIGNGLNALFEFPDQLALLQVRPELMESAIEEFLRFDSPLQIGNRGLSEDMEIGGIHLSAGTQLVTSIGGANRDPAQFPDPDRLDIARTPNKHVAFAAGIHACLGAPLARMEGRIAIGRLVGRFPNLSRIENPTYARRARFRGLSKLRIAV